MKRPEILNRLHAADRAWLTTCAWEKFVSLIKWFLLTVLLLIIADLVFQLGSVTRLSLGLALIVAVLGLLGWLFYAAFLKISPPLRIARLLEDRDETLGSKLVNILQMQDQANDETQSDLTRTLAHRAIDDAAAEIGNRDFVPLTKSPTLGQTCKRALFPALAFCALVFGFFSITKIALVRYLDPFGDHPPFALTRLEIVTPSDDKLRVVYGEPANIEVSYSGHRPGELFLSVEADNENGERTTVPMFPAGDDKFVQQIDTVTGPLKIRAHTRTKRALSTERKIGVILNPQLTGAEFKVTPPAYTKEDSRKSKLALEKETAPSLSVLQGSEVDFYLESNRPLSEGAVSLKTTAPEAAQFKLIPGLASNEEEGANQTATASLTAAESGRLVFDMRDVTGLSTERELAANLVVTHDLPPKIEITQPQSDGVIVDTFTAKIVFHAEDDYGLSKQRIHISVNDKPRDGKEFDFSTANPPLRDSKEVLEITPKKMICIPGDIISIFADTTDIRPEPQLSKTRVLKLEVVSEEQYNEFIRMRTEIKDLNKKYSKLQDELKELADEQRELAKEAQEVAEKLNQEDSELSETEQQQLRDELAGKQSELNSKLNKLAKKMESATSESPLYDLEKDLQKVLDEEAQKIRESTAQNQKELQEFLEQQASNQSMESFEKQANEQADRLDPAREEAEKKMAEAIDQAQKMQDLLKALNAFQQAYQAQCQICKQTAMLREKENPTREDRLTLQQLAAEERAVGEVVKEVVKQLREGAERAREEFPKSAQEANDIADKIEKANLPSLTDSASSTMLAGKPQPSDAKAQRVKEEMEKLSSSCSQCQGGMGGEFSLQLQLMQQMMAGNTFSQMSQCQKFSLGTGKGMGVGLQGSGMMGMGGQNGMGFSQPMQNMSMLGGASDLLGDDASKADDSADGLALDERPLNADLEKADGKAKGVEVERSIRPSKSANGEITIEEYKDIVEAYFRKLTTDKKEKTRDRKDEKK